MRAENFTQAMLKLKTIRYKKLLRPIRLRWATVSGAPAFRRHRHLKL